MNMVVGNSASPENAASQYPESKQFDIEFGHFWNELSDGMEFLVAPDELPELKEQARLKEQRYYGKVYGALATRLATGDTDVVCLFDIDGTIGEPKEQDNTKHTHTTVRPAFSAVVKRLGVEFHDTLRFGFLTTRPIKHMREELENPTYLQEVRAYYDKQLAYSSHEPTLTDPLMDIRRNSDFDEDTADEPEVKRALHNLIPILGKRTLDGICKGTVDAANWYDTKLQVLAGIHRDNPTTTLFMVDDMPYLNWLDPTNDKVHGVYVGDERQWLLPPDN